jgi:hypothetical protein
VDGEFKKRNEGREASQREAEEEGNGQKSTSTADVVKQNWHPVRGTPIRKWAE